MMMIHINKVKHEFLDITGNVFQEDKLVIMSSVMPSAKYSCSSSPLIFVNGKTAIEGGLVVSSSVSLLFSYSLFSRSGSDKSKA